MSSRSESQRRRLVVSTSIPGIKPGDYPVGSLQSRAAARAILEAYAEEDRREKETVLSNLTPYEEESLKGDPNTPRVQAIMIRLLRVAQNRAKVYGTKSPFSTIKELRDLKALKAEIDRQSGGRGIEIESNDGVEWIRLKAIAEKNLRAKKK